MTKGWKSESARHSLARKGIETALAKQQLKRHPMIYSDIDLQEYYSTEKNVLAINKSLYQKIEKKGNEIHLIFKSKWGKEFREAEVLYKRKKYPQLSFHLKGNKIIVKQRK
jgi:hypothetical protein